MIAEAKELADTGVKELILVAQDTTRYGIDLYGEYKLTELLRELAKTDICLLRLMYCYPELVTDELLKEIAFNDKVSKYIDIPMQHFDNGILKLMNRRSDSALLQSIVDKTSALGISLRTTFMVGFPTETNEQFENLCAFAKRSDIEHIGIFAYSTEEDTPSAKLKPRVPLAVKKQRIDILGQIHLQKARERGKKYIGKVVDVVYEDIDYDRNMFVGRTQYNAPEIDSLVYFTADFADVGNVYKVRITDADDYDLIGEVIK